MSPGKLIRCALDSDVCSPGHRYIDEFRMRPDQAGKGVKEMAKAAGVAWNSLTQEEKDVSSLFPSNLCLSAIDLKPRPAI